MQNGAHGVAKEQPRVTLYIILTTAFLSLCFLLSLSSSYHSSPPYTGSNGIRPDPRLFPSSSKIAADTSPPSIAYLISGSSGDSRRILRLLFAAYHPRNRYLLHLDSLATQSERNRLALTVGDVPIFRAARNVDVVGRPDFAYRRGSSPMASTLHGASILLRLSGAWDWFVDLSVDEYPLVTQDGQIFGQSLLVLLCLIIVSLFVQSFFTFCRICLRTWTLWTTLATLAGKSKTFAFKYASILCKVRILWWFVVDRGGWSQWLWTQGSILWRKQICSLLHRNESYLRLSSYSQVCSFLPSHSLLLSVFCISCCSFQIRLRWYNKLNSTILTCFTETQTSIMSCNCFFFCWLFCPVGTNSLFFTRLAIFCSGSACSQHFTICYG